MQGEFQFDDSSGGPDGEAAWRRRRDDQRRQLAAATGLPLGHRCRVELADGAVMDGLLRLATDDLILPEATRPAVIRLTIGRCEFGSDEIERVVRLD